MVSILRSGVVSVSKSDGTVPIGGYATPFFPSPLPIVVWSTSQDDNVQLVVFGIDDEGNRQTEFVSLKGQTKVATKNAYAFIDKITVKSGGTIRGLVTIERKNGVIIGSFDAENSVYSKAEFLHSKKDVRVVSFGASARANAPTEPIRLDLVSYRDGARITHHTVFVPTVGGCYEKKYDSDLIISVGDPVRLECSTIGTDVLISGWLEVTVLE